MAKNYGYIDIRDSTLKTLNILFGGRGVGKTFSVLKHRVENAVADNQHKKFIWMRDSEAVIKKIAAGNSLTKPIETVDPKFPEVVIKKIEGNYCFVIPDHVDSNGDIVIGYLMALSTFHNARGISYEDVNCIVWDEFIPEEGTIVKKNQGAIFLNMYESVNRNREFVGLPPCQIIFLSNTNDIYSDVLEDLGVSKLIEDMMYRNIEVYRDDDMRIEFLQSAEFTKNKANTFLYRINKNEKFKNMALNNKFTNNMTLIKPKVNLKGSKGLFNISNKYVLVQLADGSLYFKIGTWKNIMNYDMDNDQEAILYRLLFNDKLRLQYIAGNMFFDSIYTQRTILEWSRI